MTDRAHTPNGQLYAIEAAGGRNQPARRAGRSHGTQPGSAGDRRVRRSAQRCDRRRRARPARAAPPSRAVSTQMPSSRIATECSQCAAREPSSVTTVQSSSSTCGRRASPRTIIGSTARHMPGPQLGAAVARRGSSGRRAAGASRSRCRGRRTPRRSRSARRRCRPAAWARVDDVLDGLAHRAEPVAARRARRCRPTCARLGGRDQVVVGCGRRPVRHDAPRTPSRRASRRRSRRSRPRRRRRPRAPGRRGCRAPPRR